MPTADNRDGGTVVFVGGQVLTMTSGQPVAEAAAFCGGRILHVGAREEVIDAAGSNASLVDLAGGTLLPGFQDAHVHPLDGGLGLELCDLNAVHSLDDYLATAQRWATAHGDAKWVRGGGWYRDAFPDNAPHRRDLDRVLPDRPAYFNGHDGHTAWVNSVALALAGIDRHTPDPAHGVIERDADGQPTGVLVEDAATLVAALLPGPSRDDLRHGMLTAQRYLHSLGITAWQDAIVGEYLGMPDPYDTYLGLEAEGLLTARVRGALWWELGRGLEQLPRLLERRELTEGRRFYAGTVKIMQDGLCENCTGAMLAPYLDEHGAPTGGTGLSFIEPSELAEITTALDAHGFQVHFHGVGDRAVRECLDAIQAARETNGHRDLRHQIAHVDLVDPDDVPRFAELDVVANLQPLWARRDLEIERAKLPLLGVDREAHHFPFGALAESGARLAMGSDWPVTNPDPLWGLHSAVHRTAPRADPHADDRARSVPLDQRQRLTGRTALAAYTSGAAFANHLDAETGRIAPGMLADLVVVDRDLTDDDAFEDAAVVATYVDGVPVYDRRS
jgi:predicted amidohydrolase YtcJ